MLVHKVATPMLLVTVAACGSSAQPDAAASASGKAPAASAAASAAATVTAAPSAAATPSLPPSASASAVASAGASATPAASASAEPAAPWACGAGKFERVGAFHAGPELFGPSSRDELPAPFAWTACGGDTASCSELDLGNAAGSSIAMDLSTPRGPLFIVWGGSSQCSHVLSVDLDGNVQTAIELQDQQGANLRSLTVGQGAYMARVDVSHSGSPPGGYLIGSALTPPATAIAEEGEEANGLISDRLWVDTSTGAFGILGSAKSKGKFEKTPKAYAVVHGAVLGLTSDGAKITIRNNVEDAETDVLSPEAGRHVAGFDASPSLIAWVEAGDADCVVHTSPFALTPMGRAAPLKPKALGAVACDDASSVAIQRGGVLVGNDLVRASDGQHIALAKAVCGGEATHGCVRRSFLGATEKDVYFVASGKIRRVALASLSSAPSK